MRTRVLSVLLVALLITPVADAASPSNDGSAVALLSGDRTLAPLRFLAEAMGATVQYSAGVITIASEGTEVILAIGSRQALIGKRAVLLDVPPMVISGVSYVPVRFVSEALGAEVECLPPCREVSVRRGGDELVLRVAVDRGDWLLYRGPWFDIEYPRSFRPLGFDRAPGSLVEKTFDRDGISFGSPDGAVEFYVYSPQWSGDPGWIQLAPGEREIERSVSTEGTGGARKVMTWVTIAGPEGAGRRSYVQIRQPETNVEWYFGFRYQDAAAYARYRPAYLHFRNSLVQYAD